MKIVGTEVIYITLLILSMCYFQILRANRIRISSSYTFSFRKSSTPIRASSSSSDDIIHSHENTFQKSNNMKSTIPKSSQSGERLHYQRKDSTNSNLDNSSINVLERLEGLEISELKALYKKLGGKSSPYTTSGYARECHELLIQVKKTSTTTTLSSLSAQEEIVESNNNDDDTYNHTSKVWNRKSTINIENGKTAILRPIGKARSYSSHKRDEQSSYNEEYSINSMIYDSNTSTESWKSVTAKFPTGYRRDNRLATNGSGDMELLFLGTASCIPTTTRGVSCVGLRFNSCTWLFDCGESTQIQIQKSKFRPSKISKIFITHTHGDHAFGLPGLLCLMGQARQYEHEEASSRGLEHEVLDIYGPQGIRNFVRATLQLTFSRIGVPHRIHELKNVPLLHRRYMKMDLPVSNVQTEYNAQYGEVEGGKDIFPDENGLYSLFEEDGIQVTAAPLQHSVPCVGYVVKELPKPGSLRVHMVKNIVDRQRHEIAKMLQIRDGNKVFAELKKLKPDQIFTFPDGTVVKGKDIVEPELRGRKIVIMGDNCNGDMIIPLAQDANILVHEATNAWIPEFDQLRYPKRQLLEKDTYIHGHSTPHMAGNFAKRINAKQLILTHFSPRYKGDDYEISMSTMWKIEDMAREASGLYGRNDVVAAWDFMSVYVTEQLTVSNQFTNSDNMIHSKDVYNNSSDHNNTLTNHTGNFSSSYIGNVENVKDIVQNTINSQKSDSKIIT